MPECASEDAARYPLSAHPGGGLMRSTGAANTVEVSKLLRIAHKGIMAGLEACISLGPMATALYADEPHLPSLQLQLDVHGCALQAALPDCNPMCPRLSPYVSQAVTL